MNFLADFSLLRPWWLLALVPVALALWRRQPADGGWDKVVDAHLRPHVLEGEVGSPGGRLFPAWALVLAVLALAGPSLGTGGPGAGGAGGTRVLVVDLSPAMAGEGKALEMAKLKMARWLDAAPPGETALVVYGGEPYLVAPPTGDGAVIARFLPELAVDAIPVPGNRPDRALALARQVLERSASSRGQVLWVTAGAVAPADPGLPLAILHTSSRADPALAALARAAGGVHVAMTEDDGDIRQLVAALADGATASNAGEDLGPWLLLLLLPLAALAGSRGLLALLPGALLLGGLALPGPAEAVSFALPAPVADYLAWRRFQAGGPADFADLRWRAVTLYRAERYEEAARALAGFTDADSLYNRGNALARSGQLAEALAAYDQALKLRPGDEDIRHNREVVKKLLDQEPEDQGKGGGGKGKPPPPAAGPPARAEEEAARLAEQWLRRVPDEPATLLRRKLLLEHRRRQAGEAAFPW